MTLTVLVSVSVFCSTPVSEGTTTNLSMLLGQVIAVVVTAGVPYVSTDAVHTIVAAVILLCGLLVAAVEPTLKRRAAAARADPANIAYMLVN